MRRLLSWTGQLAIVAGASCSNDGNIGDTAESDGGSQIEPGPDGSMVTKGPDGSVHSDGSVIADANQVDAPKAQGCASKSYKLCEDFESSTVNATPTGWTVLQGWNHTATTVVASDASHSGSLSLKSNTGVTGSDRVQKNLASLGATAGTHWGRIFYKVQNPAPKAPVTMFPDGATQNTVIHATFVALEGGSLGESRVVDTVENTSGKYQFLYNVPNDSCCSGTNFNYTFDANWHCAEWYVDQATQSFRYFYDSTEVTALKFNYGSGSTKANLVAFTAVGVGWIDYQAPTSPFVAWFDDLAIDDTQIGCN